MKLSDKLVNTFMPQGNKLEDYLWDDQCRGLGVRVRRGQKKVLRTWIVIYTLDGATKKKTLGDCAVLPLEAARQKTGDFLSEIRLFGREPFDAEKAKREAEKAEEERRKARITTGEAIEKFLVHKAKERRRRGEELRPIRATSLHALSRLLRVDAKPLHDIALEDVSRRHCSELVDGATAEVRMHRRDGSRRAEHLLRLGDREG